MKPDKNNIVVKYCTSEQSKQIIESLQETFKTVIIESLNYYRKNKDFSYSDYLKSSSIKSLDSVKACLKNSLDYYFDLLKTGITFSQLVSSIEKDTIIVFTPDQFVFTDDDESSYIIFSDLSIALAVEVKLQDLNINSLHLNKKYVMIGEHL